MIVLNRWVEKSCFTCRWHAYVVSDDRRPISELRDKPVVSPHICIARLLPAPVKDYITYDFFEICSGLERLLSDTMVRVKGTMVYLGNGRSIPLSRLIENELHDTSCRSWMPNWQTILQAKFRYNLRRL